MKEGSAHTTSVNDESVSVGKDEASFNGIPAVNNLWDAPTWQLASLCSIALIVIFQPNALNKSKSRSFAFWVTILAVSAATPETTLFQILSTILSTRTSYPYIVVIPHSFIAAATYRSKHGDNIHSLQSMLLAFFLYGFGGSIVSDLLMGLPVTALSHARIIPCYIIGWSLVWLCPFDVLYQNYRNSSSSLHHFLNACEAVDSVTTPMGRISRSARELPNKVSAPIAAGLLAGFGGAGVRHAIGESTSIELLETAFWKTLSHSLLWWWMAVRNCQDETYDIFGGEVTTDAERLVRLEHNNCQTYGGSDVLRVVIVCSYTCWTMLVGAGFASGHPLVWLCKNLIRRMGMYVGRLFRTGLFSEPGVARKKVLVTGKNGINGNKKKD